MSQPRKTILETIQHLCLEVLEEEDPQRIPELLQLLAYWITEGLKAPIPGENQIPDAPHCRWLV